jgi:hypothetical protein
MVLDSQGPTGHARTRRGKRRKPISLYERTGSPEVGAYRITTSGGVGPTLLTPYNNPVVMPGIAGPTRSSPIFVADLYFPCLGTRFLPGLTVETGGSSCYLFTVI